MNAKTLVNLSFEQIISFRIATKRVSEPNGWVLQVDCSSQLSLKTTIFPTVINTPTVTDCWFPWRWNTWPVKKERTFDHNALLRMNLRTSRCKFTSTLIFRKIPFYSIKVWMESHQSYLHQKSHISCQFFIMHASIYESMFQTLKSPNIKVRARSSCKILISVYFNCYCDICATRLLRLWQKPILYSIFS